MKVTTDDKEHLFEVQLYLNGLDPDAVRVELYAEGANDAPPERHEMERGQQLVGAENGYTYSARVPATRPTTDFTARLVPSHPGVAVPLEADMILWQR